MMPHLILEYSSNLKLNDGFKALFKNLHSILAQELPTDIANCKSRAVAHAEFYLGDGAKDLAFVHLQIKIMPGRTREVLDKTGHQVMEELKKFFHQPAQDLKLQITLEFSELPVYFKS
jgi:5-carboxymethyl-2-hydroxymuconate isomerase